MAVDSSKWGSKIGPRIAMLVSQALVHTHNKLAALKHKIAMSIFHAISDEISEEVDTVLGPFIAKMHAVMSEDHPAFPFVNFMHTQHGQLKAMVGTGVSASGLLGALSAIMNNELAPAQYDVIRSNPHLIPSIQDAVNMAATGVISDSEVNGIANANGFDNGWAAAYRDLANNYPTSDIGLDLLRRGLINDSDFTTLLQRGGIPPQYWGPIAQTRNDPVSVADAALGVLRGNISMDEGAKIAAANGFDLDSFNIIINNTGEPPGTMQLLEAYRRGFIDKNTLDKGILQSRVRDEWIPTLEKLRYSPMSVADAVNAVVQNHMSASDAAKIAEDNGLEPGALDILTETAGEPLSRTEMEDLYNRGLATETDVEQALRESRLKNKYVKLAFELHAKVMPVATVQHALRYGVMSHDAAVSKAIEYGYSKDDAATIVNASVAERIQVYRERVIASAETLYVDSVIDITQAKSIVEAMGRTGSEAEFILKSFDFRRNARIASQVVTVLKSKYLQRHITRTQVINDLNAVGIPADQRDQLMQLWDLEHDAYTKVLTPAQIVKAVKIGKLTPDQGVERLMYDGYNKSDAELLIEGA